MGRYVIGTGGFEYKYLPDQRQNLALLAVASGVGRAALRVARRDVGPTVTREVRLPLVQLGPDDDDDAIIDRFADVASDEESKLLRRTNRFARGELISAELVGYAQYEIEKKSFPDLLAFVHRYLPRKLRPTLDDLAIERDAEHDEVDGLGPAGDHLFETQAADYLPLLALEMLAHAARHNLEYKGWVPRLFATEQEESLRLVLSLGAVGWKLYETGRLELLREVVRRREPARYAQDHALLAQFLQFDDRFEEALAEMERALALTPDNASWVLMRGTQRHFCKDFRGALADYNTAERMFRARKQPLERTDAFDLHRNRGEVHLDLGNPKAALRDLELAAHLDARDRDVKALLATARERVTHGSRDARARAPARRATRSPRRRTGAN